MENIEEIIKNTTEENQKQVNWTKVWSTKYPILKTYQKEVDIPKYAKDGEVGNILKKNYLTGQREYELYFDFIKWFNEADGGDYCVEPYSKVR